MTMKTPLGLAPVASITDSATVPTGLMTANPSDGTVQMSPFDIPRVAAAPNYNPSLVEGRPRAVYCTADDKLYVWTTGTTWLKTGALT